jgi:CheY-like chemotaxis protein
MANLTPRDDIRKKVSEILKRVDQLIRAGDIDQSIREIIRAKEIDPKNVYIRAYEERLAFLKEEHEKHAEEERTRKAAEEAARKRDEEARKRLEEEWKRQEEQRRAREEEERRKEQQRLEEQQRKKLEAERRAAEQQKERLEEERRQLEDELRAAEEELRRQEEELKQKAELLKRGDEDPSSAVLKYRQALREVWLDGAATQDEEARLSSLRGELTITDEQHRELEKEVKFDMYYAALKRAWSSGAITPQTASQLSELRKKFLIPPEDHDRIEARLLWELRQGQERADILVVDDDTKLLGVITETLQEAGFNVKSFPSSDDAFTYLKQHTPDLILSDINLETSTMGGFTFYEKVRELDALQDVPFIFLSGLTDEVLIRTGKEMGVDDYITKPFSDETLIATIKGKLKRYKQLKERKARNNKT